MKKEDDHDDHDHNQTTSYSDNVQMDDCKCRQWIWKYGPYNLSSPSSAAQGAQGRAFAEAAFAAKVTHCIDSVVWSSGLCLDYQAVIKHRVWERDQLKADFNDQISKMLILINQISKVLSAAEAQAKQAEQQAVLMQVLTFFWWKWCWFEVDEKTRKNKLNWFSLWSPLSLSQNWSRHVVREQHELPKRWQVCDQDNFVISNN